MSIPTYTCMNCDETTTVRSKVRILTTGWITCIDCQEKFGVEYA